MPAGQIYLIHITTRSKHLNHQHRESSQNSIVRRYDRLRKAFQKKITRDESSQKRHYQFLENVHSGVLIVDPMGRIVFINREMERITGYRQTEILKSHFRLMLTLDDIDDGFKLFYKAAQGGYSDSILLRIRKKDHSTGVVEMHTAPFDFVGQFKGVIAFVRDISERKRLEEMNRQRVQNFIHFSDELKDWQDKVAALKREVNGLLLSLGRGEKYNLSE